MALFFRKSVLIELATPLIQPKRFRGKINIQKPKPPHFIKAMYLKLAKPWYLPRIEKSLPAVETCTKGEVPWYKKDAQNERNIYQEILAKEIRELFEKSKLIGFCHYNPMSSDQRLFADITFKKSNMLMLQHGKSTVEMAVKGTPYEAILSLYVSRNMIIFSEQPNIKEMLKILKKYPQLILIAAVYESKLITKDELLHYSQIPNLQAAQAGLVHVLNSAGSQLVSNLNSHQSTLVSHLEQSVKQLEEE